MDEDLEVLKRALIVADLDLGVAAAQRLMDAGADPKWVLEEGMAVAMFDLGEMWKRGEVFLPEVVASASTQTWWPRSPGKSLMSSMAAQKSQLSSAAEITSGVRSCQNAVWIALGLITWACLAQ